MNQLWIRLFKQLDFSWKYHLERQELLQVELIAKVSKSYLKAFQEDKTSDKTLNELVTWLELHGIESKLSRLVRGLSEIVID